MQSSLHFCKINALYLQYIQSFDDNAPRSDKPERPFVGILLSINSRKYYAPLRSPKPKHNSMRDGLDNIFKMYDGATYLGLISFNNMIPVPDSEIQIIDFDQVIDINYRQLLFNEHHFVQQHREIIRKKAIRTYNLVNGKRSLHLVKSSCNFLQLEIKCDEYMREHGVSDK